MVADRRRLRPLDCRDCGCRLAVDQRYCVECGARARSVPRHVRHALLTIASGLRTVPAALRNPDVRGTPALGGAAAAGSGAGPRATRRWWELPDFELPSPRAVAASVLAVLGFGVLIGSGNLSFASGPLMLVVNESHGVITALVPSTGASASAPASGGSGSSGAGSSGGAGSGGDSGSGSGSGAGPGTTVAQTATTSTTSGGPLPPISHVWVIQLGTAGYPQTFAATGDRYLNTTLAKQGELISQFYGVTQGELANEMATISGQGPTPQTQAGCPDYTALKPGHVGNPYTQVLGSGCVFPRSTATLAAQLAAKHDTWKAYVQGLGSVVAIPRAAGTAAARAARADTRQHRRRGPLARVARVRQMGTVNAATCRHPVVGSPDRFQTASASDPYVTWRDPFVYFRSVTKSAACGSSVVGLDRLASDLRGTASTPNVSFIYANPCDDGTAEPCRRGAKGGLGAANDLLKQLVPEIEHSAAYKADGLILVTFAQAPQSGPHADTSTCCDNPESYPNLPDAESASATSTTTTGASSAGTGAATGTGSGTAGAGTTTDATTSTSTGILPGLTSIVGSSPVVGTTTATTSGPGTTTTGAATTGAATTETTTSTAAATTGSAGSNTCGAAGTTTSGTTTTGTATSTAASGAGATTVSATTTVGGTTSSGAATTTTTAPSTCTAPGGGQVGMLAISQYITPGGSDVLDSFNDFSLLASIENLFGLTRLGYAADPSLPVFGTSFYSAYTAGS